MALHLETEPAEREHRCRALSSDEDSFCQDGQQKAAEGQCSARRRPREPLVFTSEPSSGYSSVQSTSPSTSTLMPCTFTAVPPASHSASAHAVPGFRLLVPMQRPRCAARRQVKRKNAAAHSGGEMEKEEEEEEDDEDVEVYAASVGFLSL